MCRTAEDLDALRDNLELDRTGSLKERKAADCIPSGEGLPAVEVDQRGSFEPDYLVRVRLPVGDRLFWVPRSAIRN